VFLRIVASNLSTIYGLNNICYINIVLNKKLSNYFLRHITYTMLIVMAGYISNVVFTLFSSNNWIEWSIQAVVCSLVVLIVLLVPCCRTKEF